nr:hypothetical protein [Pseudomonadota bacterium]
AKNGPNATVVLTAVAALLEMSVEFFNGIQNFCPTPRVDVIGLVRSASGILEIEMSSVAETRSSPHFTNRSESVGMALGV